MANEAGSGTSATPLNVSPAPDNATVANEPEIVELLKLSVKDRMLLLPAEVIVVVEGPEPTAKRVKLPLTSTEVVANVRIAWPVGIPVAIVYCFNQPDPLLTHFWIPPLEATARSSATYTMLVAPFVNIRKS